MESENSPHEGASQLTAPPVLLTLPDLSPKPPAPAEPIARSKNPLSERAVSLWRSACRMPKSGLVFLAALVAIMLVYWLPRHQDEPRAFQGDMDPPRGWRGPAGVVGPSDLAGHHDGRRALSVAIPAPKSEPPRKVGSNRITESTLAQGWLGPGTRMSAEQSSAESIPKLSRRLPPTGASEATARINGPIKSVTHQQKDDDRITR